MMDLCLLILASVIEMSVTNDLFLESKIFKNNTSVNITSTNNTSVNITSTNNTSVNITTPTAQQCQNGGLEVNRHCLCPDDFTGEFCELSNVCPETTVQSFTFPKTIIGQAGYSKELCPSGKTNAGFPKATSWCQNKTYTFATPQELDCSLNLNTIDNNLISANLETRQRLASNTQILTSRSDKLTQQNISTAANIVYSLLTNKDSNQDVNLAAVITVSQLLDASMEQFYDVTPDSITSLTQTLQTFSLRQSDEGSALVQPNVAVQSFKVSKSREIQMTAFSGNASKSLSANQIKTDNTFTNYSDQVPIDVQINVKLKEVAASTPEEEGTNIGFVLYNNDQFFRSEVFRPSLNTKRRVITGHLGKENAFDFVNFTMNEQSGSAVLLNDFACVWWDYTKRDWTTEGCRKDWSSTSRSCRCEGKKDLANFAMLMSFHSNPELIMALSMVSIIGCTVSVVGLTLTIIFQILTRKSRKSSPTVLLVSICVCMTIVYLLFIFGIKNSSPSPSYVISEENVIPLSDFHQDPDYGPCTAFTVLLHYFLLAAFTWSTLYAAHIFLLLKNSISGPPQFFGVLSIVVGWGLPAVVVGISLGITYRMENPLNYRQEALCWLAAVDQNNRFDERKPMLWGFLLPVAVMLLFNIAVLFYFSYTTCRTNPDLNSSQVTPLRNKMLGCVCMAVVLGLSWVIGYFMLLDTNPIMHNVLSLAFCLCNTTQGVQIFVLFTLRTPVFKEKALAVVRVIPVLSRHSKKFDLWATEGADHEESYRSVDFGSLNLYRREHGKK